MKGPDRGASEASLDRLDFMKAATVCCSVAVFAGLSGRTNRFGLFLVHQLVSLADSLSCPSK